MNLQEILYGIVRKTIQPTPLMEVLNYEITNPSLKIFLQQFGTTYLLSMVKNTAFRELFERIKYLNFYYFF